MGTGCVTVALCSGHPPNAIASPVFASHTPFVQAPNFAAPAFCARSTSKYATGAIEI